MPERHSSGSSGGSSSGSSSSGSSYRSSSSSSSWSSRRYGGDDGDGPSSPEQRALGWALLIIMLLIFGCVWIANQIKKSNEGRNNAGATATTQAITLKDLANMHAALDDRMPAWKERSDRDVHRVSASDAGFGSDPNAKEVDYGYCAEGMFYVYVLNISPPGGFTTADTEGYAYTPGSGPSSCHPSGWQIVDDDGVGSDWHFVTIGTAQATYTARLTLTGPYSTSTPLPRTATSTQTPESKQ